MSHYEVFKAPKEKVENLKCYSDKEKLREYLDDCKKELLVICMKKHEDVPGFNITKRISEIRFKLQSIEHYVDAQTRHSIYEQYCMDDKGEFYFCGWEYSRPYDAPDMQNVTEYVIEKLVLLSEIVETPNYFTEQEYFYDKVNAINGEIEYFCESVSLATDFNIMEEFKEYKLKDDEDTESISEDFEEIEKQQESSNTPQETPKFFA